MSKKIRNGKFVERTAEEEIEFQRLKVEYYANVEKTTPKFKRRPKIEGNFVPLKLEQIDRWNNASKLSKETGIFFILLYENYLRNAPFRLPADKLIKGGFSRTTQKRVLAKLEKAGLISVLRRHKGPPTITVLL